MTTPTATVYIVDDNPEFRESARYWLEGAGYSVQTWGDPRDALKALCEPGCDGRACLLLDVRMPHLSGLDLHDALRERARALPVIYMSGHADVPLAVRAMQKGAVTFLEKPFDDAALEAALETALAQPPAADRRTVLRSDEDETSGSRSEFERREASLTPREREVLGYVAQGVYNKVIADRINLSIKTVELYRARGLAKMRARSVAELTRMMVSKRA